MCATSATKISRWLSCCADTPRGRGGGSVICDTGASDIVFWDAPKVMLYTG
jgi:hypothetical protein